ncbi:TetR/AcrR family transcriptional regulator C-terminal domain-containing protein [Naumannella halotolerans]|uniref:TetR/AcrR family transcriptional regulator C-terminal domain-containing protein n=1 Tax=Naumannella halotolerans TaxID=993414 RepID=UPI00370D44D1
MPLTADEIERSALEILDRYGLGDLSMRRIATGLGVAPGALYWHVANKQQLLIGLARRIVGDPEPLDGPWQSAVGQWARSLRSRLLEHRDGAELVASAVALADPVDADHPDALAPAASLGRLLVAAGMSAGDADAAADTVLHFTLGQTMAWQSRAQFRELGITGPGAVSDSFDFGLELIIDGMQNRVSTTQR